MFKIITLLSGIMFGFGLIISQMINPAKVTAFLDISGNWDPSLALVMAGAIVIAMPVFQLAKHKKTSSCGLPMQLPSSKVIDKRLIMGSLLFGVGWGIAGFCPAPALVSAATGQLEAIIFSLAMLTGFYLFAWLEKR